MSSLYLLLFTSLFTVSNVNCFIVKFDTYVFSVFNNIVEGITNFGNLVNDLREVFNVANSKEDADLQNKLSTPIPEDAFLNMTQLVKKYGYPIEEHKITTEDGYILNIYRMPHGRNGTKNNMVIFLMHGLTDSSDCWVLQGPNKALAYILADLGFDVWMGNSRGNKYALAHETLKINQSEFWQFSWEQIGTYDTTAAIDYALNMTKQESLYYVGHSQGTTSFYVMNSMKPEYNKKVKMMFSLAPVAWMSHIQSPIVRMFSPAYKIVEYIMANFNAQSPSTEFSNKINPLICSILPAKCDDFLFMIVGKDFKYTSGQMLKIISGHMPSGASVSQFVHYGQLVESGRFCRYDYSFKENLEKYGQRTPPDYDISKLTVPIVLFFSGNDWLSSATDVEILKKNLPNLHDEYYIADFNHLDYLHSYLAKDIVYSRIIQQIYDFENENKNETKVNSLVPTVIQV